MNRIAAVATSALVVLAFAVAGVGMAAGTSADAVADETSSVSGPPLVSDTNETEATNNTSDLADDETADNTSDLAANDTADNTSDLEDNETTNGSLAPGARLAGVIGVQQAEFQGEVENRAFGLSIAAARSNASKAKVIANETERIQERIQRLEQRQAALNESYQNGSISNGTYQARQATLTAQIRMLERLANQTVESASGLPPMALQQHGVNVTRLEQLRTQAHNMTGPEVARIARQIAGNDVGHPLGKKRGPPEGMPGQGPPGDSPGQGPPGDSSGQGPPGESSGHGNPGSMGPGTSENATNGTTGPMNGSGPGQAGTPGNMPNGTEDRPGNATDGGPPANRTDGQSAIGAAIGTLANVVQGIFG